MAQTLSYSQNNCHQLLLDLNVSNSEDKRYTWKANTDVKPLEKLTLMLVCWRS